MKLNKNKKILFLTDIDNGLENILQEEINIQPENMLTIRSYGADISHPYGDIMRSVILAIYEENVEEIFVVGAKDRGVSKMNVRTNLESTLKEKIQTLEYLFQNSMPEFSSDSLEAWLNVNEHVLGNIENSVEIIRHHPLVPSNVKVQGLIVNNKDGNSSIMEVPIK